MTAPQVALPDGTRLLLIRHAESEGNAGKIMQGAGEYPLSARGRQQALLAAPRIASLPLTLVAASDLSRARDTALLTTGRVDLLDPRLRERGAGDWEGRTRAEMEATHPGSLEDDRLRPGFEPRPDVFARMDAACRDLLTTPGLVAAFTHGAVMRLFEAHLGGPGDRFTHLEALCLGEDMSVLGRAGFADPEGLQ